MRIKNDMYIAKIEDIDEVFSLILNGKKQMKQHNSDQWNDSYPNKTIVKKDIDLQRLWIVGKPIKGCVTLYSFGNTFFIERFVIHSNYKGEKIGNLILNNSILLAKETKGINKIIVVTSEKNDGMNRLLRNFNFTKIDTFKKSSRLKNEWFIKYKLMI